MTTHQPEPGESASAPDRAPLERFFALFEKPRDPRVFAVFRVCFFFGVALHFFPALLSLEENYAPGVFRSQMWSGWLFHRLGDIPPLALRGFALLTMAGCLSALVGFYPRVSSCMTLLGAYSFASFNSVPVQTLALANAFAILPVFCVCRGASAAWSVDAWLQRRAGRPPLAPPALLANLVLWQLLLAFFFAGIEKILWGWPMNNEMAMLFKTPRGYILRDWAWSSSLFRRSDVGALLSWFTVLSELLVPVGLWFRRTRLLALFVYEALFVGIVAMIEVPPLFFAMFAVGMLLILDEQDRERLRGLARRAWALIALRRR